MTLSATDRIEIPKMGDKTVGYVKKALDYGKPNPELIPSFLDLEALAADDLSARFPGDGKR